MNPHFTLTEKIILGISLIIFVMSGSLFSKVATERWTSLEPAPGGTYREAQIGRPRLPNPIFCPQNSTDEDLCALIFAGLTRFDSDAGHVVSDIAEDWSLSSDHKTYTFYLNPQATWHDGVPVTADDVVFTFDTVLKSDQYQGPFSESFDNVEIKTIDEHTVVFILDHPEAFFLRDTTIGLLPVHLLAAEPIDHLENSTFNQKPIGAGPFKLTSLSLSEAKLTRHDQYHGTLPFIENIVLTFYPDIFSLQQDQLRIKNIKAIPAETRGRFEADPDFDVTEIELPQYVALFFNTESSLLRHRQVRRALRSFINVEQIVEQSQPARQIIDPIFIRRTAADFGTGETVTFFAPGSGADLLTELGWKKDDEERFVIERKTIDEETKTETIDNVPVSFRLLTTDREDFRLVAETIAAQLDWAGIDVELDIRSGDQFIGALAARDYDLLLYGESVGRDLDFYPFWHSSQSAFPGLNLSQYANLEVDRLLTEVRLTFDGSEQGELLTKVRDFLLEDVPAVWLFTPLQLFTHEPDLQGIHPDGFSDLSDRLRQLSTDWFLEDQLTLNLSPSS